jgi:hypothetical protein
MKHLLLALLLAITFPAWSGIGSVSDHKGTGCEIVRSKNKLSGNKGSPVESMDTFVTGSCTASIQFKDDTRVKVTENSKLLIDDFVYDPKKSDAGRLVLKVGMGTVRYASGQIAKNNPQQVDIKTPTATIAVRGTDFTMTVNEAGESLIVLVPSCKDESEQKKYELEENRCKVGKIEVTTSVGVVILDQAFHATYVASPTTSPTPAVVINTIEGGISNNLILVKPLEIQKAIAAAGKSKRDLELEDLEAEAQRALIASLDKNQEESTAQLMPFTFADGKQGCNPQSSICVNWEKANMPDMQARGKGVAFRIAPNEHYVEIKTTGYASNTSISVTHNDMLATEILGDGSPGGNVVNIKQNMGVLKR